MICPDHLSEKSFFWQTFTKCPGVFCDRVFYGCDLQQKIKLNAVEQNNTRKSESAGSQNAEWIDADTFAKSPAEQQGIDQIDGDRPEYSPEKKVENSFDAVIHGDPLPVRFLKGYAPEATDMMWSTCIFFPVQPILK